MKRCWDFLRIVRMQLDRVCHQKRNSAFPELTIPEAVDIFGPRPSQRIWHVLQRFDL